MKLNLNEDRTVLVAAEEIYGGDPVLEVAQGEVYRFEAAGGKTWVDWWIRSSAKGFWNPILLRSMKRVKSAKCFELCGTIGQDEDFHFRIGMGLKSYTMPTSGRLYFFPNDSIKHYKNNKGSMKVRVTRLP